MNTILVTGGAGFIGSNLVRLLLERTTARIIVIDKLTYAGNLRNLEEVSKNPRYHFIHADITDAPRMEAVFADSRPTAILNLAAESHVDRSIDSPESFVETNIRGTFVLLDAARKYFRGLTGSDHEGFRFLHVSTDEVYGSLPETGFFTEETRYAPNSPYAASKAAADHLVRAYVHTFGLPALVTNCSNNYGPFQFPEKLIPLMIMNALEAKKLPIYGDGSNVRDWLYVEDHCDGILTVLEKGKPGEHYNIGTQNEKTNLQMIDHLCAVLEELEPAAQNPAMVAAGVKSYQDLKTFVTDRPGHDRRYAIDPSKIMKDLDWKPKHDFASGIHRTVAWYLANKAWCEEIQSGNYMRQRLGLNQP